MDTNNKLAIVSVICVSLGICLSMITSSSKENTKDTANGVTYFKDKYGTCYEHTASEKHIAVGTVDYVTTVDCNGTGL